MTKLSKRKAKQLQDIGNVLFIPGDEATAGRDVWLLSSAMGKPIPGAKAYLDVGVCAEMVKNGELVKLRDDYQTGGIIYALSITPTAVEGVNPQTTTGSVTTGELGDTNGDLGPTRDEAQRAQE